MSLSDITPESVLREVRAGKHTRDALAEHFQVLPLAHGKLAAVIADMKTDRPGHPARIVEHPGGVLHPNDLIEQLPHDSEED